MELKPNMYVRTKDGEIFKCLNIIVDNNNPKLNRFINEWGNMIMFDEILKASHTLLGNNEEPCLIEVGDYVNGERVINIMKKHKYLEVSDEEIVIDEKNIKSIVTREQFEQMQYKVGD